MRKITAICLLAVVVFSGCAEKRSRGLKPERAENWLVTYVDTVKIGYSVMRRERLRDGYRLEGMMRMNVDMGGVKQDVRYSSEIFTAPDFSLRSFDFRFQAQGRTQNVTGVVEGRNLKLVGKGDQSRTIPLRGPVYPMAALGTLVVRRNPAPDAKFSFDVFDVSVVSVVPVQVTVLGRDTVSLNGEKQEALKMQVRLAQVEMTSWLDAEGLPLVELSPPRMRSVRTTAAQAMAEEKGRGRLDILRMFRVPVDTTVAEPARVRRAVLEITGIKPEEASLAFDYQRVIGNQPLVIEISTPSLPAEVRLPVGGQEDFLKPTLSVQCDHPEIKAKAREVVGPTDEAVQAARTLASWVFAALNKVPTASFPSALEVLRQMEGDCNEHAVLYAALARALGIPTKITVGLVYMEGAFYYHAWNEVFLGRWIPVDATLGEFPASALHLKLGEGELSEQAQVLAVVGRIGIRLKAWETSR